MNENIKRDIIDSLKKSIKAIKKQNLAELREQSNKTIHNASIYQDKFSISISVVMYALLKIMEKNYDNRTKELMKAERDIINELKKAKVAISKNEPYNFSKALRKIIIILKKLDKETGLFIQKSLESSKVKRAYKLYRHGVSSGKAAELLGITQWELQPYLGQTRESEQPFSVSKSVEQRIKYAKGVFSVK